ncbi:MAG: flagellar hook-basal body complex protein [Oscillospiraceae bacterium]|jgi:flagellar basal body rod protein FlgG|nr:flagellar hook-basal body complex protein [Oscillospiraceae bacterium]
MFMRGFYNATQAMIVKQRELDAVSNNIANINTSGYRKDEVVLNTFMEELIWVQRRRATHEGTFRQTYVDISRTNLEQSNFDFTGSRFDMAIWGNMYFNVTDRYGNTFQTRAGQFELDDLGYLCLNKAGRVQGANGDIYIGNDDFIVNADGVIMNPDEEVIDTLLLTYIPPDADVAKIGDNLFRYDGEEGLPEGETFDVIQGAFEKSNVDGNKEISKAMEIQRMFEANSAILKHFDTINTKTASMAKY